MEENTQKIIYLSKLESFTFGEKDVAKDEEKVGSELERLEGKFIISGQRRSIKAVILVHNHSHPHVLLLKKSNDKWDLPGGHLRPEESDIEGVKRKLNKKLSPVGSSRDWEVQDLLAEWWRPEFESYVYPYCPPHVSRPKESIKVYLISQSESCTFAVPKNMQLIAVPLCDLYSKADVFGHIVSSLPLCLSKYQYIYY